MISERIVSMTTTSVDKVWFIVMQRYAVSSVDDKNVVSNFWKKVGPSFGIQAQTLSFVDAR